MRAMVHDIINKKLGLFTLSSFQVIVVCSCLFLIAPFSAKATHIVGGEIGYRCLGSNKYEITLRVYRDCKNAAPNAFFDDPGVIGVFSSNGFRLNSIGIKPIGNDTLREGIDSCYTSFINNVCVHTTVYKTTLTLTPRVGGYHFVYQRCCRNATISNIVNPDEAGATYNILLTEAAMLRCNSSPVVNSWPPVYVCANQELNVSSAATDVNNDSIAYKLCAPLVGGTLQRPQPIPPFAPPFQPIVWREPTYSLANMLSGEKPLSIDVTTGVMKGTPPILGQFVVGVCIEEYDRITKSLLSTVRRDFQYNVVNCIVSQATFQAPKEVCVGTSFSLKQKVAGIKLVEWFVGEPGAEKLMGKGDSVNLSFAKAGKNRVTLYFERGTACQSTFSLNIESIDLDVNTIPVANQTSNICRGAVFQVDIQNKDVSRPLTYVWKKDGNLLSDQKVSSIALSLDSAAIITLQLTNSLGCTSTLSFPVVLYPSIQTGLLDGVSLCRNQATATNPGFNSKFSYEWSPQTGLSNAKIGNPLITLSNNQVYSVKITDPDSKCDTTVSFNAQIKPFGATLGLDTISTVCYNVGKQINPNFNKALTYLWRPAAGLSDSTIANPIVTLKESRSYQVLVKNPVSGCDTTIAVRVEVSPMLPVVELDTTLDFCPNIPKKVNLPSSSLVTYAWSPTTGLDNPNVANPTFNLKNNQIYTVKITDPKTNCNLTWKINAQVSPEAVISAGRDTILCKYGFYTLNASSSIPLSFQWSKSPDFSNVRSTQATYRDTIPRGETSYLLKATDTKGCFWTDTVSVRMAPVEATMPDNYVVCKPIDLTTVAIKDNDPGQGLKNYSWFPVGALTTKPNEGPNAIFKINATTLVNVNFENKFGCKKTLETQLELIDLKINISTDRETLIKGNNETSVITVTGCSDCTYAWTPATGLNATNTPSVRATPQDTTIYKVVVTKKGCKEEKTIRINVDNVNCGEPNIFVPNAFTPNNDGNNDILKVRGRWISKLQFVVYNRWGQQMFSSNDVNNGWNGLFKGNDVAPDVYHYYLKVTCLDNKDFIKSGNTTLIK